MLVDPHVNGIPYSLEITPPSIISPTPSWLFEKICCGGVIIGPLDDRVELLAYRVLRLAVVGSTACQSAAGPTKAVCSRGWSEHTIRGSMIKGAQWSERRCAWEQKQKIKQVAE